MESEKLKQKVNVEVQKNAGREEGKKEGGMR